jgi:hypothetical protein
MSMQLNQCVALVVFLMSHTVYAGERSEPGRSAPQEPGIAQSYEPTDPEAVERYWTKERMEAAKPMPFPQVEVPPEGVPPHEQHAPEGAPVSTPGQPPTEVPAHPSREPAR